MRPIQSVSCSILSAFDVLDETYLTGQNLGEEFAWPIWAICMRTLDSDAGMLKTQIVIIFQPQHASANKTYRLGTPKSL